MNYIWNESRMPEMGLSGLMSGEWKRSAGRDIQAPATERTGNRYGPAYTPPRHSSTLRAPWKGAELQWESKPTRQLSLQPVAAEAGLEVMNGPKPLVQKARSAGQRASRP